MKLKNFTTRLLFCLPFITAVLYVRSYHGELINNAQVEWQYVQSNRGKLYLALDICAPSGIKIEGIFSDNREITNSWQLINYPNWYKGKENFHELSQFQKVLHPYLPYNNDLTALYTNGWYTFLYEWDPQHPASTPPESSIRIKYQNIGTLNYYNAEHVPGMKIISNIVEPTIDGPTFNVQILYPLSPSYHRYSDKNKIKFILDNLISKPDSSKYVLQDLSRNDYTIYILDEEKGYVIDSLKGFVRCNPERVSQVYSKTHTHSDNVINFDEIFRHTAAILFMIYFVLICKYVGAAFVRWRGVVLDSNAAKLIIPISLGIILLTYLFFIIGILKLLYFPVLFVILSVILFFGAEFKDSIPDLKAALINQLSKIKKSPWRIVFLTILALMLIYNLSYCFVPATYLDGSGDIVNSHLPILNYYIISHNFEVPIYNATYGISSQAFDVLRTVVKIFIGEPGVYLLSLVYILLILGGVYLIGKEIFHINSMLIYLSVLLLLSADLFTEGIHLGKLHPMALSFLLISLYSMRFSEHSKNYILPALFFAFLSSQYIHFAGVALAYYIFIFTYSFLKHKKIKGAFLKLHIKSLIIFCLLCPLFYLKLICEVGTCFPPGMIPAWLSDLFLNFNQNNALYRYIDNNYIRHFYIYNLISFEHLRHIPQIRLINKISAIYNIIEFKYILLFLPLLLMGRDRCKMLYVFEVIAIILVIFALDPFNSRLSLYYIYPLVILQFGIFNILMLKLNHWLNRIFLKNRFILMKWFILMVLFIIIFDLSASGITLRKFKFVKRALTFGNIRSNYKITNASFSTDRLYNEILPVFLGQITKYQYLLHEGGVHRNFDHGLLIRQYTDTTDTILIVPVRFHSHTMRFITARHALGSVIYQKDLNKIMEDLKKLNINYLSTMPICYKDYNPFYTPIFEEDTFYKYFKLLFSDNGKRFYKIIHDGTNEEYSTSPFNVMGLPFVPMMKDELQLL